MKKTKKQLRTQKSRPKKANTDSPQQTFADHITEVRKRLFVVAIVFLVGSAIAYQFKQQLIDIIMSPLDGQKLIYLTPGGGFSFILQIIIYAGLVLAAPALVYQLHAFIRPALPERAQKSVIRLTLFSTLLICSGITYGYFVAVPAAIQFLNTFAEGAVAPTLTADSYLSFFLAYVGGLALLSLIPLIVIFWHWISPLTPSKLLKSQQWVVVLAFVLAAIITPTPDAFNQMMIALPVIGIYQFGAGSVLVSIHKSRRLKTDAPLVTNVTATSVIKQRPAVSVPIKAHTISSSTQSTPNVLLATRSTLRMQHRRSIDGFGSVPQRPAQTFIRRDVMLSQPVRRPAAIRRLSVDGLLQ